MYFYMCLGQGHRQDYECIMNVFWCKRILGHSEETGRTWGEHTVSTQKGPPRVVSFYHYIFGIIQHLLLSSLSLKRGIPLL